jgi:cytochrome b
VNEPKKRPVWDLPTRIFHWGFALSVVLSMLIVYGRQYAMLHVVAGSAAFMFVLGRVVWGIFGTKYVRFSAFLKGIKDVKKEFAIFKTEQTSHTVGHPAVAGWVMLLLMFCGIGVGVSGFWLYAFADDVTKESALYWHEIFANSLLVIAFVHVQGVFLHVLTHKDGIVKGMIDGKRPAYEHEQIKKLSKLQILLLLVWFGAVLGIVFLFLKIKVVF